jgi:hypothetical protein
MLLGNKPQMARSAIFWDLGEWWRSFRENRGEAAGVLPVLARDYLSKPSRILKYRRKPAALVDDAWIAFEQRRDGGPVFTAIEVLNGDVTPSPLNGDLTGRQGYDSGQSLVTRPVSEARVRVYVERLLIDGDYVLGDVRVRELEAMVRACQEAGVELIFFELPLSNLLLRNLPGRVYDEFLAKMRSLAHRNSARFVTLDDLQLQFDDSDFAEQSHLNLSGALKFTTTLSDRVLLPVLKGVARP